MKLELYSKKQAKIKPQVIKTAVVLKPVKPKGVVGDTYNQYKYCYGLYKDYFSKDCGLIHVPKEADAENMWSYFVNIISWMFDGNKSGDYVSCLKSSTDKYNACMEQNNLNYDKQTIPQYTVSLGDWLNTHLEVLSGVQMNSIVAKRVKGCDGGYNIDGSSNPLAQNNDLIHNNSKGFIQNFNFDNLGSTGFCRCPIGSSFNVEENKCKCPSGQNPVYSYSGLRSGNNDKLACCTDVNCNDPAVNPGFDENNIATYKFYDCLDHTCKSYS